MSLSMISYGIKEEHIVPNCLEDDLDPILLEDSFIGVTVPVRKPPDAVFVDPNNASHFSQPGPFEQQNSVDDIFGRQFADAQHVDGARSSCQRQTSGDSLNGWFESNDLSEYLCNLIGDDIQPTLPTHVVDEEPMPKEEDDDDEGKIREILDELYRDSNQIEAELSDRPSPSSSYNQSMETSPMSWTESTPSPATPCFKVPKSKVRSRGVIKERKKQQNREAATRYRMKKKLEKESAFSETDVLLKRNRELKGQVEDAEYQIKLIKGLISDVRSKRQSLCH